MKNYSNPYATKETSKNKFLKATGNVLFWIVVAMIIGSLWRLDYVLWRELHPEAPTYIYFVRGGR